jgi:Protein of unknown function (DUF3053)
VLNRRIFICLSTAALLTACADTDQEAAKALSEFLKARILDRPGIVIARPNQEQVKSFGRFAADYEIITRFHDEMNASAHAPSQKLMSSLRLNSVEAVMKQRAEIAQLRDSMQKISETVDGTLKKATDARERLNHPEILKATYAAAFEKNVIQNASLFREIQPALLSTLDTAIEVADFVEKNKADIKITGMMIEVSKPEIQSRLNAILTKLNSQGPKLVDVQNRLRNLR